MRTILPHRTVVTSFSSPTSQQQQQPNNDEYYYDAGEYILSIASSSSSSSEESSLVAAALSDKSIVVYDASSSLNDNYCTTSIHRIEKAHDGPISEIEFFPSSSFTSSSTPLLISAGQDGYVKVWDLRCRNNSSSSCNNNNNISSSSLSMRLALPNEKALCVSLGYGGTLAAVGTDKARISFFDLRFASNNGQNHRSGALLASYVDAHTEEVTKVRFQTTTSSSSSTPTITTSSSSVEGEKTILASASEDGLIALHDPSQPTEEAALLSVLNIGIPTRNIGFFGPNYEGLYALTGSESMSVHHWDSGQRICDVGGGMGLRNVLRDAVVKLMSDDHHHNDRMERVKMSDNGDYDNEDENNNIIEYLVGCTWAPQVPSSSLPPKSSLSSLTTTSSPSSSTSSSFPALQLLAGNSQGDGFLFQVDADKITPLMHLKGGHKGCIRDFSWIECDNNGGGGRGSRLFVTGGEDARLCEWDVYGNIGFNSTSCDRDNNSHHRASRGSIIRGGGGGGPIYSGRGGHSNLLCGSNNSSNEKRNGGGGVVVGRRGKKKHYGSPY